MKAVNRALKRVHFTSSQTFHLAGLHYASLKRTFRRILSEYDLV